MLSRMRVFAKKKGALGSKLAKKEFTWLQQAQKTVDAINEWEVKK